MCEFIEVVEEVLEFIDDDNKDISDQDLIIFSFECNEMFVFDLMKEIELFNFFCNSFEMELEKFDKEDVILDLIIVMIFFIYFMEIVIKF